MKRQWITVLAAIAVLLPAGLGAQESDVRVYSFGEENRGRIGVMVDMKADADADKLGARIQSVVPDGPAAKAGLKAGDIITEFNGVSLGGVAGEDDMSGPGNRLIELAHELEPGDQVEIDYRRGDDTGSLTLTADKVGGVFTFRSRGGTFDVHPDIEMSPRAFVQPHLQRIPEMNMFFGEMAGGLQLAELNDDLAEYFGTSEGALVMAAPRDTTLALKGGDVIVAIDGRTVESPSHARRILQSYNEGETAAIVVMRQKQRTTVNWTVPERHGEWHFRQPRWKSEPKVRVKKESRA